MRLVPDSWGARLREYNDCNLPKGAADGGRFGRNDDPRCKGGASTDTQAPRDRIPKGEDRQRILTHLKAVAKHIRTMLKLDETEVDNWTASDYRNFLSTFPNKTRQGLIDDFGLDAWRASEVEREIRHYGHQLERLEDGEGAWSDPDPVEDPHSGAAVRERVLALAPLKEAVADTEYSKQNAEHDFNRHEDHWKALVDSAKTEFPGVAFPRFTLRVPGSKTGALEPEDGGASLKAWLNDPDVSADERDGRASFLSNYEHEGVVRQNLWMDAQTAANAHEAAAREFTDKSREAMELPRGQGIKRPEIEAFPSMKEAAEKTSGNLQTAQRFMAAMVGRDVRYPGTVRLEPNIHGEDIGGRGYASSARTSIYVQAGERPEVIVHELAHHIEYNNPDILQAAIDFRDSRVHGKIVPLNTVLPDKGYKDHELAYDGSKRAFEHAYAGKVYSLGASSDYNSATAYDYKGDRQYATEVVTMGLQQLFQDPQQFAENDPDWFDWTIDVLRKGPAYAMRHHKSRIPTETEAAKGKRKSW